MNPSLLTGAFLLLIGLSIVAVALTRKRGAYTGIEYWVYFSDQPVPEDSALLDRVLHPSPEAPKPIRRVGPQECRLLSDIRLHRASALRKDNPFSFRPDLFAATSMTGNDALQAIAGADRFMRVRFVSDKAVSDRSYLKLVPALAYAYLDLLNGAAVYDTEADCLYTAAEFKTAIAQAESLDAASLHLRVELTEGEKGYHIATKGMRKIGVTEICSDPIEADNRTLVGSVLMNGLSQVFANGSLPTQLDTEYLSDSFRVVFETRPRQGTIARVFRVRK